jgi:hypothetical protein
VKPAALNPPVGPNREDNMKHVPIMLATIGLIAVSAANHAAQADTTLYTSATHAGKFDCNVVNVSQKPLNITISIIGSDGLALFVKGPLLTPPFTEVSGDFGGSTEAHDAFCVVQVSGTGDRNDVRAALNTNLARTFSLDGGATNVPTFVFKVLEAH